MEKIPVGVLGATGSVGQQYVKLLTNHPIFDLVYLAASPQSAGKPYTTAAGDRWFQNQDIPANIANIVVEDAANVDAAAKRCKLVFSAIEMDKAATAELELAYAKAGLGLVSNSSAHRWTEDVPMIIPEVNQGHLKLIDIQRKNRGYTGFVVVKSNCSLQSYMTPLFALMDSGYYPENVVITTEQATSGAGIPGVPSLFLIDNIIPYISGEEDKSEGEPFKILGELKKGRIIEPNMNISATCTRVPVRDGHMACVEVGFRHDTPKLEEVIEMWETFRGLPQELKLPSAPEKPIIYRKEENRPQPFLDRDAGNGMAVTVGRLRDSPVFDIKFVGLSHNTIRGAAGGAILTAELIVAQKYL